MLDTENPGLMLRRRRGLDEEGSDADGNPMSAARMTRRDDDGQNLSLAMDELPASSPKVLGNARIRSPGLQGTGPDAGQACRRP